MQPLRVSRWFVRVGRLGASSDRGGVCREGHISPWLGETSLPCGALAPRAGCVDLAAQVDTMKTPSFNLNFTGYADFAEALRDGNEAEATG